MQPCLALNMSGTQRQHFRWLNQLYPGSRERGLQLRVTFESVSAQSRQGIFRTSRGPRRRRCAPVDPIDTSASADPPDELHCIEKQKTRASFRRFPASGIALCQP
jgi:hypothetical protein